MSTPVNSALCVRQDVFHGLAHCVVVYKKTHEDTGIERFHIPPSRNPLATALSIPSSVVASCVSPAPPHFGYRTWIPGRSLKRRPYLSYTLLGTSSFHLQSGKLRDLPLPSNVHVHGAEDYQTFDVVLKREVDAAWITLIAAKLNAACTHASIRS